MLHETIRDTIRVKVYEDRALMGAAAAGATTDTIRQLLMDQPAVNIVFAAAPSQNEFLAALSEQPIDWTRINAFHMDEYIGREVDPTRTFAWYLKQHLFERTPALFATIHYLNGGAGDPVAECQRYTALLRSFPTDLVCMGIGENNHIAFNDPPVADFNDPEMVKIVTLDPDCRQQQVNDGCFPSLKDVPERALTLTIPALMKSRYIFGVVPGERKATAIHHTLNEPVSAKYPSTILKTHAAVQLFLDRDSSKLL